MDALRPGIRKATDEVVEALDDLLDLRFEAGDRLTVPVLGSGVNRQAAEEVGADALNWGALLEQIEQGLPKTGLAAPRSMTARWESLLLRGDLRASSVERRLAGQVADELDDQTDHIWDAARGEAPPLYTSLLGAGFRDLVTLNFDDRIARSAPGRTLFRPLGPASATEEPFKLHRQLYQRTALHGPRTSRLWQPHGRTDAPPTILLGVARYGRYVEALDLAFDRFKRAERDFGNRWLRARGLPRPEARRPGWPDALAGAWLEARRATLPPTKRRLPPSRLSMRRGRDALSWLDLFMTSPLVFVGCSLGSDEFPLWWALHQRARNQARLPPTQRHPTVVLTATSRGEELADLEGGPAGVTTVVFGSWHALWAKVRGLAATA
jgi:hypothetical protein